MSLRKDDLNRGGKKYGRIFRTTVVGNFKLFPTDQ